MFRTKPETKQIVRFPEDRHPKVTVLHQIPSFLKQPSKTTTDIEVEIPITKPPKEHIPDLSAPKLNSSLCVKNSIKNVKKTKFKKVKTVDELQDDDKATYDERITKILNYPFDKKLYKQLISLKLTENTPFQYTASHETVFKDIIPKLDDFYEPPKCHEYSIPIKSNIGTHTATKQFDGLRLHKVMKTWKDNRPD